MLPEMRMISSYKAMTPSLFKKKSFEKLLTGPRLGDRLAGLRSQVEEVGREDIRANKNYN